MENAEHRLKAAISQAESDIARNTGKLLPPSEARSIRARMGSFLQELDLSAITLCGRHGDFWPGNVFVENGAITDSQQ